MGRAIRIGTLALLAGLLLAPRPLPAHMISISQGEVRIEGERLLYDLRMPLYEIAHVRDPERTLLDAIRFRSAGPGGEVEGRMAGHTCESDAASDTYHCRATYEFPAPIGHLAVECRFHEVTVANHVHLIYALREGATDRAVLDASFRRATLRFEPPRGLERLLLQSGAGALRVTREAAPLLFVLAIVVAARSRRELAALVGMFIAGQVLSCLVAPRTNWLPAPAFVEAAAALTIAYLAVEVLLLPEAGQRWAVVGALGVFHGLYLVLLLRSTAYQPLYVLAGAGVAESALAAALAYAGSKFAGPLRRFQPRRVVAAALLVTGLLWFFMRLGG